MILLPHVRRREPTVLLIAKGVRVMMSVVLQRHEIPKEAPESLGVDHNPYYRSNRKAFGGELEANHR